jgi:hypothetical protein
VTRRSLSGPWRTALVALALAGAKFQSAEAQETAQRAMSATVATYLHGSIVRCWNIPPGAGSAQDVVQLRLEFRRDGSLARDPVLLNPKDEPGFTLLATSALRAVRRCEPYAGLKRHAEAYKHWRTVVVNFRRPD